MFQDYKLFFALLKVLLSSGELLVSFVGGLNDLIQLPQFRIVSLLQTTAILLIPLGDRLEMLFPILHKFLILLQFGQSHFLTQCLFIVILRC